MTELIGQHQQGRLITYRFRSDTHEWTETWNIDELKALGVPKCQPSIEFRPYKEYWNEMNETSERRIAKMLKRNGPVHRDFK